MIDTLSFGVFSCPLYSGPNFCTKLVPKLIIAIETIFGYLKRPYVDGVVLWVYQNAFTSLILEVFMGALFIKTLLD